MKTISGTYYKGKLELDEPLESEEPLTVKVTIEEPKKKKKYLKLSDFNFAKGQEITQNLKSSLSEEVIRQRREG